MNETKPTPEITISTSVETGNLTAYTRGGLYIAFVDSIDDLPSLTQATTQLGWVWDGEPNAEQEIRAWLDLVKENPLGEIALRIAASEWGV